MLSWFSKKAAAALRDLSGVVPVDLSGALAMAVSDLSGAAGTVEAIVGKWWPPVWLFGKKPATPVLSPPVVSVPAAEEKKSDLIILSVAHSSIWMCTDYNLKITVSLPESLKAAATVVAAHADVPASVPASVAEAVPEVVAVIDAAVAAVAAVAAAPDAAVAPAPSEAVSQITNQEIYDAIESVPSNPESEKTASVSV